MDIEPSAIFVLAGTIFGGVGLRVIDHFLTRRKVSIDESTSMRQELRTEIDGLRKEIEVKRTIIDGLEAEIVEWREKYFKIREEYASIKAELEYALRKIKSEAQRAETMLPNDHLDK